MRAGAFALTLFLFALTLLAPGNAQGQPSCGEVVCSGKDACKDDRSIGDTCPSGSGTFCLITCDGESACSGDGEFKPSSESGHILCSGKDACKDAEIKLQGSAVASQWKVSCSGEKACENLDYNGVGNCSGASCPTCSASEAQLSAAADSYLEEKDPNDHNPTAKDLKIRKKNNDDKHALIRFDLSSLPAGSTPTAAHLSLEVTKDENSHTVLVYALTQSWTENDVSWNDRSSGLPWPTPGGSYDPSLLGSFSASSEGRKSVSSAVLTSLVQGWADGSIANHGLIFLSDGATNKEIKIGSREDGSDAPYLYVEYSIDECAAETDNCSPNATCTNTSESFTCTCNAGYSGDGVTCTDIDECATNNGGCDALTSCTNTTGGFTCGACPSGYSGNGSSGCTDVDECSTNNGGCDANAACTNFAGGSSCSCNAGFAGNGTALLTGRVTVTQSSTSQWHTVSFPRSMTAPVVQLFAEDVDGDPFTLRVRNITSGGFELQLDEYDYLDGTTGAETIAWLAVATGSQTLPNGIRVDAGFVSATDGSDAPVTFTSPFGATPAVFSQVSSANSSSPVVSRNHSATGSGFLVQMQVEEAAAPANVGTESIGWIAMDQGGSAASDVLVSAVLDVGDSQKVVSFAGGPFSATPIFLADMQTRNGGDPSVVAGASVSPSQAVLFIDEETSGDSETTHGALETVAYTAFHSGFQSVNDQICIDVDECATNTDNCDANATCTNTTGSFDCACNAGYSGDGISCSPVFCGADEYVSSNACVDCPAGTTNPSGDDASGANTSCTATLCGADEYVSSNACLACPAGTTNPSGDDASGGDTTCEDLDECATNTDNCDTNATCTNTEGSFTCDCNGGFTGDGTTCVATCGDGLVVGSELCDDGNTISGDGCSDICTVESGWSCAGAEPSVCTEGEFRVDLPLIARVGFAKVREATRALVSMRSVSRPEVGGALVMPQAGSEDDPRTAGGTWRRCVLGQATPCERIPLPASDWRGRGFPEGAEGWGYDGSPGAPCDRIKIRKSGVSVLCRGDGAMDEELTLPVGARSVVDELTVGGIRYCSVFNPPYSKDDGRRPLWKEKVRKQDYYLPTACPDIDTGP